MKIARSQILEFQAALIDALDKSFDVELVVISQPPMPALVITQHQKVLLKINPMRKGRYRVLDIPASRNLKNRHLTYFKTDAEVITYAQKYTKRAPS